MKSAEALDGVDNVILCAAGSGISPIRSVIESDVLKGKSVQLYYGAQTQAKMAYSAKFAEWKKSGVEVCPVLSQPGDGDWSGATGYVQDAIKAAGVAKPENTAILLCGMKGMFEGLKELAAEVGMPEERLLSNF